MMWTNLRTILKTTLLITSQLASLSVFAQIVPRTGSLQDSVIVSVNSVAIEGEIAYRGLEASFPYPVLSAISVIDQQGKPIFDLADTSRWLGPDDIAENGEPVSQIWQPLLEYHRDNPQVPRDPNLYNQIPQPLITEVRETSLVPASTMLVMDGSGSMVDEIEDAKTGARLFVDLMRSGDRGGVIVFAGQVKVIQRMTNDHQRLIGAINQAKAGGKTALYDAIMLGIDNVKTETGRRGIIVYTDGMDNRSVNTPSTVIDSANTVNIPIFTIALGDSANEANLSRVANETGGLFFKAATAAEMIAIYRQLSELIQNYYLMAHHTTDPRRNNTWRVVDVTVNAMKGQGRGVGQYFVEGMTMPAQTDLAVDLSSRTDEKIVVDGDSANAVRPGESFDYMLRVENRGIDTADSINAFLFLPDSVQVVAASIPPFFADDNIVSWHLADLAGGDEISVELSVRLASQVPTELVLLAGQAQIVSPADSTASNNFDSDTVFVIHEMPPNPNFDLAVTQTVMTDTMTVIAGDTVAATIAGEPYRYQVVLTNHGPVTAYNLELLEVMPDSTTLSDFSLMPSEQRSDSLFWLFDSLAAGQEIEITFEALTSEAIPFTPFPLTNFVEVNAPNDTLAENNSSTSIVYAIRRPTNLPGPTDVALTMSSTTDTSVVIDGDTLRAVRPGEVFEYNLRLENLGDERARMIRLRQALPDSVHFLDASVPPVAAGPDSIFWEFRRLEAQSEFRIDLMVELSSLTPRTVTSLVSIAEFSAENDTFAANNLAVDSVRVLFAPLPQQKYDLSLSQRTLTDTSIVLGEAEFPAAETGSTYEYRLGILNEGPATARDVRLWNVPPDHVTLHSFTIQPSSQQLDTLFWQFEFLPASDSLVFGFSATVDDSLELAPFPLINTARVEAVNDTLLDNNQTTSLVYAVEPIIDSGGATDVAVTLNSITDTTVVIDNEISNAVLPGDSFRYSLKLTNLGDRSGLNIRLRQTIPDSVEFLASSLPPAEISEDSLIWEFASIDGLQEIEILIDARVSELVPFVELVSQAEVTAENDTVAGNNTASEIVRVLFIGPPQVTKFDLVLAQEVFTDTTVIIAREARPAVRRGDTFDYVLNVRNDGPAVARDFVFWDALPDSVSFLEFNQAPTRKLFDTYFWEVDSLVPGEELRVEIKARVSDSLRINLFPLLNNSQIVAENDVRSENNFASTLAFAVFKEDRPFDPNVDIAVDQVALTDSFAVVNGDTVNFARPGETYAYVITVRNDSSLAAEQVTITDFLPDSIMAAQYDPLPDLVTPDSLRWQLGYLLPRTSFELSFNATVAAVLPHGLNLIINKVDAVAQNENPVFLEDNTSIDTVFSVAGMDELLPLIEATPPVVEVGEAINVRVQVLEPIRKWDLWVYDAAGSIDSTYADEFVTMTRLVPNRWTEVEPSFRNTRLLTAAEQEQLTFEIRTTGLFGEVKTASASVTVESSNAFVLDRNVFNASAGEPMAIRFKLSTNRRAQLDLYDLTGAHISSLTDASYLAGWNTFDWDGGIPGGKQIGSGLYLVTLRSGPFQAMKKLMVVR